MNNIVLGKEIKKSRLVIYSREERDLEVLPAPLLRPPRPRPHLLQTHALCFLLF